MLKWLENYWYHYKWHTLIVAFFVIMLTVMGVQMCSREDNDIYIIYAGPELISDELGLLEKHTGDDHQNEQQNLLKENANIHRKTHPAISVYLYRFQPRYYTAFSPAMQVN